MSRLAKSRLGATVRLSEDELRLVMDGLQLLKEQLNEDSSTAAARDWGIADALQEHLGDVTLVLDDALKEAGVDSQAPGGTPT